MNQKLVGTRILFSYKKSILVVIQFYDIIIDAFTILYFILLWLRGLRPLYKYINDFKSSVQIFYII